MAEKLAEEWIVILDDGKEREELLMLLCPGLIIDYGGIKWKRASVSPLRIALYLPTGEAGKSSPDVKAR